MTKTQYIAPDGGWGWIVVIGFALNNIVTIPIMQGFGMIYGNTFKRLGITATQSTIIINVNQAFGMILGLMNGPLLRKFGYRKMAIFGNILYSTGIILTSYGSNFVYFIITYGMMASLGMCIAMAGCSLALNTYFKEKRGRAMGMSMTITGLGPIFMPQLTSVLLSIYDSEGTMLILGAISLNALIGALVLHPIKWHAKPLQVTEEKVEQEEEDLKNIPEESASLLNGSIEKSINDYECDKRSVRKLSRMASDYNDDNVSIYGFETPISMQNGSLLDIRDINPDTENSNWKNDEDRKLQFKSSSGNLDFEYKRSNSFNEAKSRKFSVGSTKYGDLGITKKILVECPEEDGEPAKSSSLDRLENGASTQIVPMCNVEKKSEEKKKPWYIRILKQISKTFDLDLLRDPVYVNIMLGMSIAIFAEFNFSVLTPFILTDMNLSTESIATMMSVVATSDLVLRALAPYIGEWLRKSSRVMYLVSLVLLILTRTALFLADSFTMMLIVAVGLGIAKGLRTVYMTLVIPSHVPLERLASASSIQSLVNGFILMIAGPFLGVIRDITGSYVSCIIFINSVTAITIVMWLTEFGIKFIKKRRKLENVEKMEQDVKIIESR